MGHISVGVPSFLSSPLFFQHDFNNPQLHLPNSDFKNPRLKNLHVLKSLCTKTLGTFSYLDLITREKQESKFELTDFELEDKVL